MHQVMLETAGGCQSSPLEFPKLFFCMELFSALDEICTWMEFDRLTDVFLTISEPKSKVKGEQKTKLYFQTFLFVDVFEN